MVTLLESVIYLFAKSCGLFQPCATNLKSVTVFIAIYFTGNELRGPLNYIAGEAKDFEMILTPLASRAGFT